MEQYEGDIVDVIYYNEENGYTVAVLETQNDYITLVGTIPNIKEEEHMVVEGDWTFNPKFGKQFTVASHTFVLPEKVDDILRYLSSGIIKGVGEATAKRIVDEFKEETFVILQYHPEKIQEIDGIGKKRGETIAQSFQEHQASREVMIFLQKYGIRPNMGVKIYKRFGAKTANLLKENPYMLCSERIGIGFKRADDIAFKMGIEKHAPYRISAALLYTLGNASSNGNTYLPKEMWIEQTEGILGIPIGEIEDIIRDLLFNGQIKSEIEEGIEKIYSSSNYIAEVEAAHHIFELQNAKKDDIEIDVVKYLDEVEAKEGIKLADKQVEAVKTSVETGMMILTGGPGTGKTTTIKSILSIFAADNREILLCAPTGRAAKRMNETTGYEAKTIHRLLEYGFSEEVGEMNFNRNEENLLEADLIIIDEASMIDIQLMGYFLKAVPKHARVILVGDIDQLPSVGPGNVLKDIINSNCVKVIRLDEIFRQAQESMIVVNAHKINKGEFPLLNEKEKDFFFISSIREEKALNEIVSLYTKRLPKFLGLDSAEGNIQILSPSKKGLLGVNNLNDVIQRTVNPQREGVKEKKFGENTFRVGDRVMQIRNNYDIKWELIKEGFAIGQGSGIFNGDLGKIESINEASHIIEILFDEEKRVKYEFSDLEDLKLAYASTVHKSQGSEFPVIIMPMLGIPMQLLSRNLLYTGITRAQKLVVIVGSENILKRMISNDRVLKRHTSLKNRLVQIMEMYKENGFS